MNCENHLHTNVGMALCGIEHSHKHKINKQTNKHIQTHSIEFRETVFNDDRNKCLMIYIWNEFCR